MIKIEVGIVVEFIEIPKHIVNGAIVYVPPLLGYKGMVVSYFGDGLCPFTSLVVSYWGIDGINKRVSGRLLRPIHPDAPFQAFMDACFRPVAMPADAGTKAPAEETKFIGRFHCNT